MIKTQIGKYIYTTFLLFIIFRAEGEPVYFEFKNCLTRQDSSIQVLVHKRVQLLAKISPKYGMNNYYIHLMAGLYDGANELIDFETRKGDTSGIMRQARLFRQFHKERKYDLSAFMERESKKTVINSQFREAANAALSNFRRIDFNRYHPDNKIIPKLLMAYYENMDQISIAYVSFGQNEKLKALCWDIIHKQNRIIELLKEQSTH